MTTIRIHLDAVTQHNAPLLIAPGSHRMGRIPVGMIEDAVASCGQYACLAETGDVWVYSTPILHASRRSTGFARRRVLQVDLSAEALPNGLEWASAA
jgi:ectoine hydroxylase-related dioxygenase (phytanoyl-CoA dioxygenase family)